MDLAKREMELQLKVEETQLLMKKRMMGVISEKEFKIGMMKNLEDAQVIKQYNDFRNEAVARGLMTEISTVTPIVDYVSVFKKMDYEELKSAVNAGLNEVWHRGETTDSIKDVPTGYIEIPDGVADPFEWRERELAKLSETLEANQKAFSDNQFEKMKEEIVSAIKEAPVVKGYNTSSKILALVFDKRVKFTFRLKAIINNKITDKVLEEEQFNMFSIAISQSIDSCFDAFEESKKIDYPLDGVFCEIGCNIVFGDGSIEHKEFFNFSMMETDAGYSIIGCEAEASN